MVGFILRRPSAAKAKNVHCKIRRTVVSTSRAKVPGSIEPTTTADDPIRASIWSLRIIKTTLLVVVFIIPIIHPFVNISRHIIETIAIRRIGTYRSCRTIVIISNFITPGRVQVFIRKITLAAIRTTNFFLTSPYFYDNVKTQERSAEKNA